MRKKHSPEKMYSLHKNLIRRKAWKWSQLYRCDIEELISEGNLVFMRALETWDPAKASFVTWLSHQLDGNMRDFISKTDLPQSDEITKKILTKQDGSDPSKVTEFRDFLLSLKPETQLVAEIIIQGPAEALSLVGSESARTVRGLLKNHLRERGWTWDAIWSTFNEIKNELASI